MSETVTVTKWLGNTSRPLRNAVFTAWNPVSEALLEAKERDVLKFAIYQAERCPETDKKHYQGYVELKKPMRFGQIKREIFNDESVHLEERRGTREEAIAYCEKEESRFDPLELPVVIGDRKEKQGSRSDLKEALKNRNMLELAENHPETFIKYHRGFEKYFEMKSKTRNWKTDLYVHYGPPGTGKSRYCHETWPSAYWKPPGKWWDGYGGEAIVILDDYRQSCDEMSVQELLRVADRYPLKVAVKGGFKDFISYIVVITTNVHPENWIYHDENQKGAMLRRIDKIVEYVSESNLNG